MPDGTLYVNSEEVKLDDLGTRLVAEKAKANVARVVVRGDQKATYDLIMQVIARARRAGLTDIALSSRPAN